MISDKYLIPALLAGMLLSISNEGFAGDSREMIELPEMMQQHMLHNMRDHMAAINEILGFLAAGETARAAEVAENRLGVSSLDAHGASHMAKFMPQGMQQIGTRMHRAASQFALKAQEGDVLAAYRMVSDITVNCVACHTSYRIR